MLGTIDLLIWQSDMLLVLESEFLNVVMSGATPWKAGQWGCVYWLLLITHSLHMPSAVLTSTGGTQTVHVVLAPKALAVCGEDGHTGR